MRTVAISVSGGSSRVGVRTVPSNAGLEPPAGTADAVRTTVEPTQVIGTITGLRIVDREDGTVTRTSG